MILDILHSFVNIFAGGRSDIKSYLFFIYVIVLYILYLFFKNNHSFKDLKWRYFGITIIFAYFYGFLLQIFYTLNNHLSLTDFFVTVNNQELSSSIIWHTHIAKAELGQIFSFFSKTQFKSLDAGGAYIGLIPSPILILGSTILIILLIQAIFYFSTSFKELLNNKNTRQKIFLIIGYAIATFALIKTSIDGGILNPSFGISIFFIFIFILRSKGREITNYYYISSTIGALLLFLSLYIDTFRYGNGLDISLIASLILLCTLILYFSEEKIHFKFMIVLLVLFTASWWMTSTRDRDIYDYSSNTLTVGQKIYFYNDKNKEIETLKNEKIQTIAQLSKKLNKNITYMPITAPGITCMENAMPQKFSTRIISTKQIHKNEIAPSPYIHITNESSTQIDKNWETILNISVHPCMPEPLSVISGELEKDNINTYLFVNPIFYDDSIY